MVGDGVKMANIKSAKKRIKISNTKYKRNTAIKSKIKTYIKKVETYVKNNDMENAKKALIEATKQIDMATQKGIYHKNNGSRKVSRISKLVNKK